MIVSQNRTRDLQAALLAVKIDLSLADMQVSQYGLRD